MASLQRLMISLLTYIEPSACDRWPALSLDLLRGDERPCVIEPRSGSGPTTMRCDTTLTRRHLAGPDTALHVQMWLDSATNDAFYLPECTLSMEARWIFRLAGCGRVLNLQP